MPRRDRPSRAALAAWEGLLRTHLTLTRTLDRELVARHFGHEPRLEFVPWDQFAARVDPEHADMTLEHIGRAPLYSMEKARTVLGFIPRHNVTDTVLESIDAWVDANRT